MLYRNYKTLIITIATCHIDIGKLLTILVITQCKVLFLMPLYIVVLAFDATLLLFQCYKLTHRGIEVKLFPNNCLEYSLGNITGYAETE